MIVDNISSTPHHGIKSERENHHKVSESHKPNMRDHMISLNKDIVLLATKSEMREVFKHPSQTLHFVLLYKDEVILPNDSQPLPRLSPLFYMNLRMSFPPNYLRDYLHYVALSTASTSYPVLRSPTEPLTAPTPRRPRSYNVKLKISYAKGMCVKVLALVRFRLLWCQRKMALGACVVIVGPSTILRFAIVTPFHV